eukprot:scaffold2036_cov115-Isochrysis_galbana.AAC.11
MPVQREWPMMAPKVTPNGSSAAASAMVAICDRSPHSARKVSVNACSRTARGDRSSKEESPAVESPLAPDSTSCFFASSSSTSSNSSDAPEPASLASRSIRTPKTRKSSAAA